MSGSLTTGIILLIILSSDPYVVRILCSLSVEYTHLSVNSENLKILKCQLKSDLLYLGTKNEF